MKLTAITPREASIFACLTDAVVAPEPVLPAVRDTDAVEFFDRWLARAPARGRLGFRTLLYVAELGPLLRFGQRLRSLDRARRTEWFAALSHRRVRFVADLLRSAAQLAYYGNGRVMQQLGYDADANVARARRLREQDGRP